MCKVEAWEFLLYAAACFAAGYVAIFACVFAYKFLIEAPHKMYAELEEKYNALLNDPRR